MWGGILGPFGALWHRTALKHVFSGFVHRIIFSAALRSHFCHLLVVSVPPLVLGIFILRHVLCVGCVPCLPLPPVVIFHTCIEIGYILADVTAVFFNVFCNRQIGRPLELDTDGIWCILPSSFPENFTFK